jgi:BirA family biotin operon repressor/biotin-[acetyl-CoA-carboxylase] ligase
MNSSFDDDLVLQRILSLLTDGQFHSGQELGTALGISRAAVWKQLQKLQRLGISLQVIKGKGYCLEGGLDLLSDEVILQLLAPAAHSLLAKLEIRPVVDSTNAQALRNVSAGSGYVCLAELQFAGRGRRGRIWVSPFGKNIYLSTVWTFYGGAAELEGLSLAVGVIIADVLRGFGLKDIELKWPNDILWRGRKLAGILIEMTGDAAGLCHVIVGIGINVAMPVNAASAIDQPWIDIQSILKAEQKNPNEIPRNTLVAGLLSDLLPMLQDYQSTRFLAFRSRWEALNAYAGAEVEVRAANTIVAGHLMGVTETGALRVRSSAGERVFYGGEVSLRPAS